MGKSKIEWTEKTWQVTRGCSPVSDGCDNCYAAAYAYRFSKNPAFRGLADWNDQFGKAVWTREVMLAEDNLMAPIKWRKPCKVFVNSMSDLFWSRVPISYIAKVYAVMVNAGQHTFQVLTKRDPRRFYESENCLGLVKQVARRMCLEDAIPWPPPNVWLGVTVDTNRGLNRVEGLRKSPAVVHFLSLEPMLEKIAIESVFEQSWFVDPTRWWIIVGGESGPHAREFREEWADHVIEQCKKHGVPCFVKQMGGNLVVRKKLINAKGGDPSEWDPRLRVRQTPDGEVDWATKRQVALFS